MVDLAFDGNAFSYSTNPEKFEEAVVTLFNKAVNSIKKIPQLEKMVMGNLFWSGTPLLESVGENEPYIKQLRETVNLCLKQATIPLLAYAKEYEKYNELALMDVEEYLK